MKKTFFCLTIISTLLFASSAIFAQVPEAKIALNEMCSCGKGIQPCIQGDWSAASPEFNNIGMVPTIGIH